MKVSNQNKHNRERRTGDEHLFSLVKLLLSLCGRRTEKIKVNVRSVMLISVYRGYFSVPHYHSITTLSHLTVYPHDTSLKRGSAIISIIQLE